MGSHSLLLCLLLLTSLVDSSISNPRRPGSKKPGKSYEYNRGHPTKFKVATFAPGQILYGGKLLPVQFNDTVESEVYAANYSKFPDTLHYLHRLKPNNVRETEEGFMGNCINATLERNKGRISDYVSEGDVYIRVAMQVIEFLCLENYNRPYSGAVLYTGGLWLITLVALLSFTVQEGG